ncbi:MAG TPA: hypothetical protein VNX66_03755 [Candidatus Sulfotelmatobacter sp.]|jgi:hypothetical protein|nr:hypothetical protein [Candidatus Sulfotelmatobacter sp.]
MKRAAIVLTALAAGAIYSPSAAGQETAARGSIREQQLRYPRVRTASQEKDGVLRKMLEARGLVYPPRAMLLRALKKEGVLELWAASSESDPYTLIKS